jgi:catechol 2,3-dioxygenase-like lactoylglutathione lyase family enzyme
LVKKRRQGRALFDGRRTPQRNLERCRPRRIKNIGLTVPALCRIITHAAQDMAQTGQGQLPMTPRITAIDHLVLTVADIPATVRFYVDVLGAQAKEFPVADGSARWALDIGAQKINLHVHGHEFEPKSTHPTPGSADLCFLSDTPADLWLSHLTALDVPVEDGPVKRTGAGGPILSIYLRDPDQNLIEIGTPPAA